MVKVESSIEIVSVRIDFNGPTLGMFAQGRIHPLGEHAPDKTGAAELIVRRDFSLHDSDLAQALEALLGELFVAEVEGMSELAAGREAKRQES